MSIARPIGILALWLAVVGCAGPRAESPGPSPATTDVAAQPVRPGAPGPAPRVEDEPATPAGFREVFPHVRVDTRARLVEFDAVVPIDANQQTYLEVLVCTPDTREHESALKTRALAAHVHAALLLVGLEPGRPGSWEWRGQTLLPNAPSGSSVSVVVVLDAGQPGSSVPITDLAVSATSGRTLTQSLAKPNSAFVFAGSGFRRSPTGDLYEGDLAGTLVGLCTFGSETIALREMHSPEAAVEEPVWIANARVVPAQGSSVVVRLSPRDAIE